MPNSFWSGQWVNPQGTQYIEIIIMGLLALGVQSFTTQALRFEKTSIVGAVGNSAVIFSILIEIILGHGLPDLTVMIGMALVFIGSYQISKK